MFVVTKSGREFFFQAISLSCHLKS